MALDDADKKAIGELISAALKNHTDELGKVFVTSEAATQMVQQGLAKGIEGLKLDEKIVEAVKKAAPAPKPGDDKGKDDAGKSAANPDVARLQQQIEQLQSQAREQTEAREQAEAREREGKLEAALRDGLTAAGVPADAQARAIPFIRTLKLDDGKPVVSLDANGKPTWSAQRKGYVDGVALADGLKDWVKTDHGKAYLPAKGSRGTGDGNGGNPPRSGDGNEVDAEALVSSLLGEAVGLGGIRQPPFIAQ